MSLYVDQRNSYKQIYITSFKILVDLLFAIGSPVSFVADTVISVDTIYTLSIDTGARAAIIDVHVAVRS